MPLLDESFHYPTLCKVQWQIRPYSLITLNQSPISLRLLGSWIFTKARTKIHAAKIQGCDSKLNTPYALQQIKSQRRNTTYSPNHLKNGIFLDLLTAIQSHFLGYLTKQLQLGLNLHHLHRQDTNIIL